MAALASSTASFSSGRRSVTAGPIRSGQLGCAIAARYVPAAGRMAEQRTAGPRHEARCAPLAARWRRPSQFCCRPPTRRGVDQSPAIPSGHLVGGWPARNPVATWTRRSCRTKLDNDIAVIKEKPYEWSREHVPARHTAAGNGAVALDNLGTEDRTFPPSAEFAANANLTAEAYERAAADPVAFWAEQANRLTWATPFTQVLDWSDAPHAKWFADGELNVAVNCVDRHVDDGYGDRSRSTGRANPATPAPSPTPTCRPRSARPRTP